MNRLRIHFRSDHDHVDLQGVLRMDIRDGFIVFDALPAEPTNKRRTTYQIEDIAYMEFAHA